MKPQIYQATREQIYDMMKAYDDSWTVEQLVFFRRCIFTAGKLWAGFVDGELVCFWGLVPPSLLADEAYLWLYTTPALEGKEFYFIRQSQLAVEAMLNEYSHIVGHTVTNNAKAIRWLKWLGAKFGEPNGTLIPFTISGKSHG